MPKGLSPNQEKAALLLAEGDSQVSAANAVGVHAATIGRWMNSSAFLARVEELCQDLTSQAVDLLRESVVSNTEVILRIAEHGGEAGVVNTQLRAALWAVEKVLGKHDESSTRRTKAEQASEAELLRMSDADAKELLERGEPDEQEQTQ
jgi:hypothetical protein